MPEPPADPPRPAREPGPGEPVFAEPWHAQVLAVAFALVREGVFSAAEWSEALGAERRRAVREGAPDDDEGYYRSALAALETLLAERGRVAPEALAERTERWREAYLRTPHGQPVTLRRGDR